MIYEPDTVKEMVKQWEKRNAGQKKLQQDFLTQSFPKQSAEVQRNATRFAARKLILRELEMGNVRRVAKLLWVLIAAMLNTSRLGKAAARMMISISGLRVGRATSKRDRKG